MRFGNKIINQNMKKYTKIVFAKHFLDFEILYSFFKDRLMNVNELSSEILKVINFTDGNFFVLLPEDANLERIYELETGLVLPQNPKMIGRDGKSTYQITPNLDDVISEFLFSQMLKHDPLLTCVIDDFNSTPSNPSLENYKNNEMVLEFDDQIYYKISTTKAKPEILSDLLIRSNTFWHSLCILTETDLCDVKNILTLDKIKDICRNVHLVMTEAYDGEGYVFWERKSSKSTKTA